MLGGLTPWRRMGKWRYSCTIVNLGTSHPYRFTPGNTALGSLWIGGWVGPRAGLVAVEERQISCSRQESNPGCPACRSTNWAIPSHDQLQCLFAYFTVSLVLVKMDIFWCSRILRLAGRFTQTSFLSTHPKDVFYQACYETSFSRWNEKVFFFFFFLFVSSSLTINSFISLKTEKENFCNWSFLVLPLGAHVHSPVGGLTWQTTRGNMGWPDLVNRNGYGARVHTTKLTITICNESWVSLEPLHF
jgi:hypothetical protein